MCFKATPPRRPRASLKLIFCLRFSPCFLNSLIFLFFFSLFFCPQIRVIHTYFLYTFHFLQSSQVATPPLSFSSSTFFFFCTFSVVFRKALFSPPQLVVSAHTLLCVPSQTRNHRVFLTFERRARAPLLGAQSVFPSRKKHKISLEVHRFAVNGLFLRRARDWTTATFGAQVVIKHCEAVALHMFFQHC